MKSINIFIILAGLFLSSCSDNYQQRYDKFEDFNKVNLRNKSWFPDIISIDAFDLKSDSYLDSLCAFGCFSYSNEKYYDSVFADSTKNQIDFSLFQEKVLIHSDRKPEWFLDPKDVLIEKHETIKKEHFYILRERSQRKVYFVISN